MSGGGGGFLFPPIVPPDQLSVPVTVTSAEPVAKKRGIVRQTPRVSVEITRVALAKRHLGRADLKRFDDWKDGRPQTELNFKCYRQATNKVVGLSAAAAEFLNVE